MNIKPIRNQQDYEHAMAAVEKLWEAQPNTPESDMLDILVEAYEQQNFPIDAPEPSYEGSFISVTSNCSRCIKPRKGCGQIGNQILHIFQPDMQPD